jgi:hypothetical protein
MGATLLWAYTPCSLLEVPTAQNFFFNITTDLQMLTVIILAMRICGKVFPVLT